MKIAIDQSIPGADDTFGRHAELVRIDGRSPVLADLRDVHALIVRSVTRVDAALLRDTAIRFVGTATIGTDHLDTRWLDRAGIAWVSAPGCNAESAAEYTLAMLLLAQNRLGSDILSGAAGIIGRGNVGSHVLQLLARCGMTQLHACDPPLADRGETGLCDMARITRCGIVSLHVPLTTTGPYPTERLVDADFLNRLPVGCLVLNTSRGNVIDGPALADWLQAGRGFAALDVWPGEPWLDQRLLGLATVATPHVAGYSQDGKLRGTRMVYDAFCRWLGIEADPVDLSAGLESKTLAADAATTPAAAILNACPVERDDGWMRQLSQLPEPAIPAAFDALRRGYPERRDFAGWTIGDGVPGNTAELLRTLGFH